MQYYSVSQVANMLNTNPETIRRWIRDKKLNAKENLVARKKGHLISEEDLKKFLSENPKYRDKKDIQQLAKLGGVMGAVSGGVVASTSLALLGGGLATMAAPLAITAGTLATGAFLGYSALKKAIDSSGNSKREKKQNLEEMRKQTNDAIREVEEKINELKRDMLQAQTILLELNDQLTYIDKLEHEINNMTE